MISSQEYEGLARNVKESVAAANLLSGVQWISALLPSDKMGEHKMAIPHGAPKDTGHSLDEVKIALQETTDELRQLLQAVTDAQWEEEVKTFFGPKKRENEVISLIAHESQHLGQVRWIFKRITGWDDNKMYEIE